MPLPVHLNTNEIKGRAGTEVEFLHRSDGAPRTREWQRSGEVPSRPERIKVQHRDVGLGFSLIRQSNLYIVKTIISPVDNVTPVRIISSYSLTIPIGALTVYDDVKDVNAYHMSFLATTGAGTTVLFDGTGNAADALTNGTL